MPKPSSFRLLKYSSPRRTVAEYTEAEKKRFKEKFQPAVENYRRYSKNLIAVFLSLAAFFLVFWMLVGGTLAHKFAGYFAVCCSVLLLAFILASWILAIKYDPICPACENGVDRVLKTFCPECGSKINPGGFFKTPQCLSCEKKLFYGKRRSYKIRHCTHCGVFLDDKGI